MIIRRFIVLTPLVFLLGAFSYIVGVEDEIAVALKTGNSKGLSKHFKANIDLSVLDKEDVYSKAQAELILKDFFSKHPPKSFKVVHKGTSKQGLKYAIGTLETGKGNFRVTYNIEKSGGREYVKQLRIDED